MDFKTQTSLTAEQMADLFEVLALSLRQNQEFKVPLGTSEISIDVAKAIVLGIEYSEGNEQGTLKLNLSWNLQDLKSVEAPSKSEPKTTQPTPSPQPTQQFTPIQEPSPRVVQTTARMSDREIPHRIAISTNTIVGNNGEYKSAFTKNGSSKWVLAVQTEGLEVASQKPEEEDLFSHIDDRLPTKKKKSVPATSPFVPGAPSPKPVEDTEVASWKEPSPEENVTDDEWAKPSELLKRQKASTNEPVVPKPTQAPPSVPKATMPKPSFSMPEPKVPQPQNIPEGAPIPPDIKRKNEKQAPKGKKLGWEDWD